MFSLIVAGRGSKRSLPSARWLNSAAAAFANRHLLHDSSMSKAAGAGTPPDIPTHHTSPRPHSQGQSGAFTNLKPVPHQLQGNGQNPAFYQTISQIMRIREQYVQERMVFVKAQDMLPILLGLGASHEDITKLALVSDKLERDPTLPFRKTSNSRFCLDFDTRSVRRLEQQNFMLCEEEDFKRHDSGKTRHFDEIQDTIPFNSAVQALLIFKALIINGMDITWRPNLNYHLKQWVCTLFNVRTRTTPDILGEPALEGVHTDGADHTMTTFLGASNMALNSATTFIHSMDEVTGIPLQEASPLNILGRARHSTLLDTILIVDHERKHSLSAVYAEDKTVQAIRDVLIFFTRRPYQETHPAASMDSLKPHPSLPMEIPLLDLNCL